VKSFAIYGGKGEVAVLRRFDLVLLNPENYSRDELGTSSAPSPSRASQGGDGQGFRRLRL
jgi:hypothetical protein